MKIVKSQLLHVYACIWNFPVLDTIGTQATCSDYTEGGLYFRDNWVQIWYNWDEENIHVFVHV